MKWWDFSKRSKIVPVKKTIEFFQKKSGIYFLMVQFGKFAADSTEVVRFLKRWIFGFCVFYNKKDGFLEKKFVFLKITDGGNFAVECNSICQIFQKTQTIWAVWEEGEFFGKKILNFSKMAGGSNFAV